MKRVLEERDSGSCKLLPVSSLPDTCSEGLLLAAAHSASEAGTYAILCGIK